MTVIDDFGHHPTAIRETLSALRYRYPGHRLWAIFEPRSNTTRRAVFQQQLPEALQLADGVFIAQIAALEQIPAEQRLDPEAVVGAIEAAGRPAFTSATPPRSSSGSRRLLQPNDVVTIFSNGGFDGIHEKLLAKLAACSELSSARRTACRWQQISAVRPRYLQRSTKCDPARSANLPAACERGG